MIMCLLSVTVIGVGLYVGKARDSRIGVTPNMTFQFKWTIASFTIHVNILGWWAKVVVWRRSLLIIIASFPPLKTCVKTPDREDHSREWIFPWG